jgi:hypothetical protein
MASTHSSICARPDLSGGVPERLGGVLVVVLPPPHQHDDDVPPSVRVAMCSDLSPVSSGLVVNVVTTGATADQPFSAGTTVRRPSAPRVARPSA